jgi:hypothetical protein
VTRSGDAEGPVELSIDSAKAAEAVSLGMKTRGRVHKGREISLDKSVLWRAVKEAVMTWVWLLFVNLLLSSHLTCA